MNPGQEKFPNFILERVQEDKVDEAKAIMTQFASNFTNK